MKKISILFILIIILSACSSNSISEIKEEGKSIRGVVTSIDEDVFKIDSQDRANQGEVVVTRRVELKNGGSIYDIGDTVEIYYDKIEGKQPSVINKVYLVELVKKAEEEEKKVYVDPNRNAYDNPDSDLEDPEPWDDSIDYESLPLLTFIKDDKVIELDKNDSILVQRVLHDVKWEDGVVKDFKGDYTISEGVEEILKFNSKSGVINDEVNDISVELYEGMLDLLNMILDKY